MKASTAVDQARRQWSETEFKDHLIEQAVGRGWHTTHFRPGQNRRGQWSTPLQGHPGYVDLTLARGGQLIQVEVKNTTRRVEPDQQAWLHQLTGQQPWDQWQSKADWPTGYVQGQSGIWRPTVDADLATGKWLRYVGVWRPTHWRHAIAVLT